MVLGVLGGASLAAFAGARRTASAYPRFLDAGHPSDLAINYFSDEGSDQSIVNAFPEVARTRTWVAFNVAPLDDDGLPVDGAGEVTGSLSTDSSSPRTGWGSSRAGWPTRTPSKSAS